MEQLEPIPPHLILTIPDSYADSAVEEVLADFDLPESFIKVRKQEQAMYAAFEWTVPTLFAVYLGKTVLDAVLKETVKELTPKLIAGIKALAVRCKQMNSRWLTAGESTEKLSRNYHQSAAFSVVVQTQSGRTLKLLFDEELSAADWEDAIDGLLATVAANYHQYPNDELSQAPINAATKPNSLLYVVYNRELKGWETHNDQTLLALQRKPQASQ